MQAENRLPSDGLSSLLSTMRHASNNAEERDISCCPGPRHIKDGGMNHLLLFAER